MVNDHYQDVANASDPLEWGGSKFLLVIPEEDLVSTTVRFTSNFSRSSRSFLGSGFATLVWHHVFHPWSTPE